jgi:hypothetical protein
MIFLIAVGVVLAPILVGILLAFVTQGADNLVQRTKEEIENPGADYKPAVTFGYQIPVEADLADAACRSAA